ncbi:CPBP family intramembrane metalloprotease [Tetragenococcus koreensis]|uniref:CAAX family amino protease n=1 Tax=Tetragenococcus koreensis TaxID=290335 RepID=A0AAN4RIZ3_9ENTE|nr:type II CAAX endopeptidase family protein [Tetragenococcus koreensis]MDN5832188.1 CPBP family intramembrane metalloprotease [Tetragenococcus halophilus]AYW45469.1 CPBP family intramembrane metalloprotease [Tetragenococcus koreensis]MCF1584063.1 CPBP family intramembrane metalloprotease [Tetragenococcus koreensis]MCF1613524.1 CPBP family intramembrane metalloprotease [Tetragenococcus koreensis]MCF1618118.1 CPBP family intramembrane metalloprotease [Tetragenococcus koreensis]
MSVRKYSLLTILIYVIAFFAPVFAPTNQASTTATTVTYLAGAILMIILYLSQTNKLTFERTDSAFLSTLFWGIAGIFLAVVLQTIITQIEQFLGIPIESQNTQNIIGLVLRQPLFALAAMIGGPIMEEFVFRRALIGLFDSFSLTWVGIIISSLLFAVIHQDGHLLLYFSLGFFFSLLYKTTGKIWTSMISHVGMNTLVVIANLILAASN